MIKIGNWWCNDSNHPGRIENQLLTNNLTCESPIEDAISYCDKFINAIDVGSWIGDSTVVISKHFKKVYGFEAHQDTFDCCIKNLQDRNINHCKMYNIALSNSKGNANFYHAKSGYQGFVSSNTNQENKFQVTTVETNTLDSFNFIEINFIKIDVDSHESYLLLGSKEFFKNNNPVIMIETKPNIYNRQLPFEDPKKILEEYGYKQIDKVAKADYVFKR
jgi:FkbM family methyltransferase